MVSVVSQIVVVLVSEVIGQFTGIESGGVTYNNINNGLSKEEFCFKWIQGFTHRFNNFTFYDRLGYPNTNFYWQFVHFTHLFFCRF